MLDLEYFSTSDSTTLLLDRATTSVLYRIDERTEGTRSVTTIARQKYQQHHRRNSSLPEKQRATTAVDSHTLIAAEYESLPYEKPAKRDVPPVSKSLSLTLGKESNFTAVSEIVWPSWAFGMARIRFAIDRDAESEDAVVGVEPKRYFKRTGSLLTLCDHSFIAPNGKECTWVFVHRGLGMELRNTSVNPPVVLARYEYGITPLPLFKTSTNSKIHITEAGQPIQDTIITTALHVERYGTHKMGIVGVLSIFLALICVVIYAHTVVEGL